MRVSEKIHRKKPDFPQYQPRGLGGLLGFLGSILLWIILLVIFGVSVYVNFVSLNIKRLLQLYKRRDYRIPFLFSLVITLFFFPVSLVVVLSGILVKIIKE